MGGRRGEFGEALENVEQALNAAQQGGRGLGGDPQAIERIAQQILNPLREAEVDLAKSLQLLIEKDKIRAVLEEDIPPAHHDEVKAYLEAVGRGR
jgi:hypothetical protein